MILVRLGVFTAHVFNDIVRCMALKDDIGRQAEIFRGFMTSEI